MTLGIRRISMLAMTFVVLTTTVGFACLVLAVSAMGMPADASMSGCGMPTESLAACPHEYPATAESAALDVLPFSTALVCIAAEPVIPRIQAATVHGDPGPVPEAPPSHLTPLRV